MKNIPMQNAMNLYRFSQTQSIKSHSITGVESQFVLRCKDSDAVVEAFNSLNDGSCSFTPCGKGNCDLSIQSLGKKESIEQLAKRVQRFVDCKMQVVCVNGVSRDTYLFGKPYIKDDKVILHLQANKDIFQLIVNTANGTSFGIYYDDDSLVTNEYCVYAYIQVHENGQKEILYVGQITEHDGRDEYTRINEHMQNDCLWQKSVMENATYIECRYYETQSLMDMVEHTFIFSINPKANRKMRGNETGKIYCNSLGKPHDDKWIDKEYTALRKRTIPMRSITSAA